MRLPPDRDPAAAVRVTPEGQWIDLGALGLGFVFVLHLMFGQFFPNRQGLLGHDYQYFLAQLLAGDFWAARNGYFSVPWFTPAFCGGLPLFANPQNPYFTLPQILSLFVDPLASVYLTLLVFAWAGYAGFYLLLRRSFSTGRAAAILGGVLFMWNGFFVHRMLVGHIAFHAFMLLPLVGYWLLAPGHGGPAVRLGRWRPVALAGLAIAYMIMAGMIHILVPSALSLLFMWIVRGALRKSKGTQFLKNAALAGIFALMLTAARVVAASSYVGRFPRDYPTLAVASLFDVARFAFTSLFGRPPYEWAQTILVNRKWAMEQHEFEFSLGPFPLALMVLGLVLALRKRAWPGALAPGAASFYAAWVGAVAILAAPLALNYHTPWWNDFVHHLPAAMGNSIPFRWFVLYIPAAILGAALACESVASGHARWGVAGAGILSCFIWNATADETFYHLQAYDPAPVVASHQRIGSHVPSIANIGGPGTPNYALVQGESPAVCYEPIFGYRLEQFPLGALRPGSIFDEGAAPGKLNLKNPACYVFPDANHCQPGDHFPSEKRIDAARFAGYRAFGFHFSGAQMVANAVSLAALLFLVLLLAEPALRNICVSAKIMRM